ncbi:hypothetical protein PYCCODRAFT_912594 [Trametes coccinea BRFM310]|uniref:Uncharacterized protein n=1 Tax=Trametes coccinea (strain BRFM310) TaxID=1353009 RepID=A0A1Y2IEI0_TRAC3|nr:hypothetical protein PYCCODRAFT_912594 [Trametes coccinea BRFM310]
MRYSLSMRLRSLRSVIPAPAVTLCRTTTEDLCSILLGSFKRPFGHTGLSRPSPAWQHQGRCRRCSLANVPTLAGP